MHQHNFYVISQQQKWPQTNVQAVLSVQYLAAVKGNTSFLYYY